MRDQPILSLKPKNRLNHGITQSLHFEEWEACIAAGLDIEKWEYGEYSTRFKAMVIGRYRLHNAIESMTQDAAIEKQKKEIKKARRKANKKSRKKR